MGLNQYNKKDIIYIDKEEDLYSYSGNKKIIYTKNLTPIKQLPPNLIGVKATLNLKKYKFILPIYMKVETVIF